MTTPTIDAAWADLSAKLAAHFGDRLSDQHMTVTLSPCVDQEGRRGVIMQAQAARSAHAPHLYGHAYEGAN